MHLLIPSWLTKSMYAVPSTETWSLKVGNMFDFQTFDFECGKMAISFCLYYKL